MPRQPVFAMLLILVAVGASSSCKGQEDTATRTFSVETCPVPGTCDAQEGEPTSCAACSHLRPFRQNVLNLEEKLKAVDEALMETYGAVQQVYGMLQKRRQEQIDLQTEIARAAGESADLAYKATVGDVWKIGLDMLAVTKTAKSWQGCQQAGAQARCVKLPLGAGAPAYQGLKATQLKNAGDCAAWAGVEAGNTVTGWATSDCTTTGGVPEWMTDLPVVGNAFAYGGKINQCIANGVYISTLQDFDDDVLAPAIQCLDAKFDAATAKHQELEDAKEQLEADLDDARQAEQQACMDDCVCSGACEGTTRCNTSHPDHPDASCVIEECDATTHKWTVTTTGENHVCMTDDAGAATCQENPDEGPQPCGDSDCDGYDDCTYVASGCVDQDPPPVYEPCGDSDCDGYDDCTYVASGCVDQDPPSDAGLPSDGGPCGGSACDAGPPSDAGLPSDGGPCSGFGCDAGP